MIPLRKDDVIPVTIGAAGVGHSNSGSISATPASLTGGITKFGSYACNSGGYRYPPGNMSDKYGIATASGGGPGGGLYSQAGVWYGGGGGATWVDSTIKGYNGRQGAIRIRYHNPDLVIEESE